MGTTRWCLNINSSIFSFYLFTSFVLMVTVCVKITRAIDEECYPTVLDEIPPEPFDEIVPSVTRNAAKTFVEYLSTKKSIDFQEIQLKANGTAANAIIDEEKLLAFGIAAPSVQVAVVNFRDIVRFPDVKEKDYLGTYWRELSQAWNETSKTEYWGTPFRECNVLKGQWLWPFVASSQESGHRVVAVAFIAADTDPCNDDLEQMFGKKHSCDRETTFCFQMGQNDSQQTGQYNCLCRYGFYVPNETFQGFDSVTVEKGDGNYSCVPCPGGCFACDSNGICIPFNNDEETFLSLETLLKISIGSILGACMLCCIILAAIVFRQRKCKTIASGMWTVLETILLGILLLYAAVAVHFFPASTERCLAEPWLRELGFMICYGAIILKLYRHLVEFRTRKAHRWVLRDTDLLKYLGTMIFAVICYLSAFTASSLDLIQNATDFVGLQETATNTCHPLKWEYVTQTSEIIILGFGIHLGIASRNAKSQYRERQFLVAAIVIEFLVSSNFYIFRAFYLNELSPGEIFLAHFVRSQLTCTVTVALIFLPKLWYQHKQVRSFDHDQSFRLPVDAFKGTHESSHHGGAYAGIYLADPDIGDLTLAEMSPEDIRAELKRLYTQLEVLKNKTLRQDNPHISKRRGGRKPAHRRFSLQALSSKNKHRHVPDMEVTEAEASRTPEDSVCSAEGPTDTFGEISGFSVSK